MRKKGYYSSGEFAKMAHISVRTVRYYDKQNLLKPSCVSESGMRFYTDQDFVRLQQILLLKYLGFSLRDIRELTIRDMDDHFLANSLKLQKKLIQDKVEQLQLVEQAIGNMAQTIQRDQKIDWSDMLELIHLTSMESSLKGQYQNSSNISARIRLHRLYSKNPQGWFPWVFEKCGLHENMRVLEIGCGDASLWLENLDRLPSGIRIVLSDISDGMIREVRREEGLSPEIFDFKTFDCSEIPYEEDAFDLVIANHMLFYCPDISAVLTQVCRVLRPGGRFICSTYGALHMKEISDLVRQFDERIVLSAEQLYKNFGKETGYDQLIPFFEEVSWQLYEDSLEVDSKEPLIEYILSCHGNQNQYILDRYAKFQLFVDQMMKDKLFHITKEAGVFLCKLHKNINST